MEGDRFNVTKDADIVVKLADQALNLSTDGQQIAAGALRAELNQFTPRELAQIRVEIDRRNIDAARDVSKLAMDPNERTLSSLGVASDLNVAKNRLKNAPVMDFIATEDTIRGAVFTEPGKKDVSVALSPACGHYKNACLWSSNKDGQHYSDGTVIENSLDQNQWRDLY